MADVKTGNWFTVNVNVSVIEPSTLVAVTVITYVPPVPAAGVPESTPVVALSVTPAGRLPVSVNVAPGKPVVAMVVVPAVAVVKVADVAPVKARGCSTTNVKVCVAVPTALTA